MSALATIAGTPGALARASFVGEEVDPLPDVNDANVYTYHKFDDGSGSTATDEKSVADGSIAGASWVNPGFYGYAADRRLSFASSGNNRVDFGTVSTYNHIHQTGIFSIMLIIHLDDYTRNAATEILESSGVSSANTGILLRYDNRSSLGSPKRLTWIGFRGVGGSNWSSINADNAITDNNEHMIHITGDASNVRMYVDKVQVGIGAISNLPTGSDASYTLRMGYRANSTTGSTPLGADVDQFIVWDDTRTPAEIADDYDKWQAA